MGERYKEDRLLQKIDAKLGSSSTDNPKFELRYNKDGNVDVYLNFYLGRHDVVDDETGEKKSKVERKRINLHLTLLASPKTPIEKNQFKETIELAKKLRYEEEQKLKDRTFGYRLKIDESINFYDYFQAYIDRYTKKDIRVLEMALRDFRKFIAETPEYNIYLTKIEPHQITSDMVSDFTDWLNHHHKGEGAKSVYNRLKKVINYAIDHDVLHKSPCRGISIKVDTNILRKEVLSSEEITSLINTHYEKESSIIRNAFIVSLYCGLRFCDVKDLRYSNIDYSNKSLSFEQSKTKGHSKNSGVVVPLSDDLINLIGEPVSSEKRDELIFPLPSHTMCLKALRRWCKRAGIEKHITWHCGRHSFAVNIMNNGANIKTVSSLLGHSSLAMTEKYTRAVDQLKRDAINSLPKISL